MSIHKENELVAWPEVSIFHVFLTCLRGPLRSVAYTSPVSTRNQPFEDEDIPPSLVFRDVANGKVGVNRPSHVA